MSTSAAITIPQTDPKASYLAHQLAIDTAIRQVLNSGWYIMGQEVKNFEQEFAAYIGVQHAIGVANGTDALELSLRACNIGPGDLVFTVSNTAVATVAAIELTGATPVMIDIDPATCTMDPDCLNAALALPLNGTPKAVIPVHLYGHPADLPAILKLAKQHNLFVIEDCAQSHGAIIDGRKTGTWGDIAAFSFYPTKNLGAIGDAGMVLTDDLALAERVRLHQQYGWRERYISEIPGGNSRLDEIQAAILRTKLNWLEAENERRRDIARLYSTGLDGLPDLILPDVGCLGHVYHQYVVRCSERDRLRTWLADQGIGTLIHYPVPVHMQPAYAGRILRPAGGLPVTEQFCTEILSLPMYPQLTDEQVDRVVLVIRAFFEGTR